MGAASIDRVRENRLRRAARRQGYVLHRSRTRDPRALDYGSYWLVDTAGARGVVLGRIPGDWHSDAADLDDIERYLMGEDE